MNNENHVFLLVGQRGAGKTEYGRRLLASQPTLSVVSRDEILMRLFGTVQTCPYTGGAYVAVELMYRLLRRKLKTQQGLKIILDAWTGDSKQRKSLMERLRNFGATRITALYFVTPLEQVETWFWQKPGIAKSSEIRARQGQSLLFFSDDAPRHDHELFHSWASKIDSDGFDEVIRVDPRKELLAL